MNTIIEKSLKTAARNFESFGFTREQTDQLLSSGKRDLVTEISRLKTLLAEEQKDIDKINLSLHAIKGLLYNMGNNEHGDIFAELEKSEAGEEQINKINALIEQ